MSPMTNDPWWLTQPGELIEDGPQKEPWFVGAAPKILAEPTAESILQELVELKALHDEVMRRKQRRAYAFRRDLEEVKRVDAMENDYKLRKPLAWEAARAFIYKLPKVDPSLISDSLQLTMEHWNSIRPAGASDEQWNGSFRTMGLREIVSEDIEASPHPVSWQWVCDRMARAWLEMNS